MKLYHYTRAIKEDIDKQGLVLLSVKERRNNFLKDFNLKREIREHCVSTWNDEDNSDVKHPMAIFFVTKRHNYNDSGVRFLISMYGGEAINMCAEPDDDVGEFLHSIGQPLEIICKIPSDDPFIKVLMNGECLLKRDVKPIEILKINILTEPEI